MRFILNFNHKCSLNCEWCYVNFKGNKPKKEIVFRIIDKFVSYGYKIITIGGGDPFNYDWIYEVIVFSKKKGLFVHIDSNIVNLKETNKNKDILNKYVDLIGIPLDGSDSRIHDSIRQKNGHYDLIQKKIDWLKFMHDRLKINTFINLKNVDDLEVLSRNILDINPHTWSLYQYCSVYHKDNIIFKYYIDNKTFKFNTSKIIEKLNTTSINLELTSSDKRVKKYPIVSSDGEVEILISKDEPYLNLGSIFMPSILEKVNSICYFEDNGRYKLDSI